MISIRASSLQNFKNILIYLFFFGWRPSGPQGLTYSGPCVTFRSLFFLTSCTPGTYLSGLNTPCCSDAWKVSFKFPFKFYCCSMFPETQFFFLWSTSVNLLYILWCYLIMPFCPLVLKLHKDRTGLICVCYCTSSWDYQAYSKGSISK